MDYLGLDWDYVLILLSYCRRLSERRGSTKSLHYVETVAFGFYDEGICDAVSLQDKLRQMELMAEGKTLHHCVGGYIKRMAEGETAIFFLRKASEPDKPFYTLELQKKRVIQCRTEHNASYDRNPDVKNFVDMWMEKVVKKGGKKKAKEAAA